MRRATAPFASILLWRLRSSVQVALLRKISPSRRLAITSYSSSSSRSSEASRCRQYSSGIINRRRKISALNVHLQVTRGLLTDAAPMNSSEEKAMAGESTAIEPKSRPVSQYVFPNDQPVVWLDCQAAFEALTARERLYAHHLCSAAWYGGLITLVQTSPESPLIFVLLQKLYGAQPLEELRHLALDKCGMTNEEFQRLLIYSSGFYTNMGNYKGFGDTKFIPNIPKGKFEALVMNSAAHQACPVDLERLWKLIGDSIYSLDTKKRQLGLGEKGVTTYFSWNCTAEDADFANRFFKTKDIEAYNTRLFKTEVQERKHYEVRLASAAVSNDAGEDKDVLLGSYDFEGSTIDVSRGDYSGLMDLVVDSLEKAKTFAANETEVKMLEEYARSFSTGSLPAHKEGSRFWIKDKGPVIETYIGFIETYRDPAGQRGEFEGFVAMVNKEMSSKFATLVSNAETFLWKLPWPRAFEKDEFLRPDFTSLDVLAFAGSGIPAGINIPNYDEIRQSEGFKNVSLGNVIPASYKDNVIPFLAPDDQDAMNKYRVGSFEVQVGLHELLGHGSGKLFCKNKDGTFNYDRELTVDPLNGCQASTSFYEPGETYDSKFTAMGSAYEECRAECVGLYLSLEPSVLKIFGYEGEEADNITYVNWLSMVWAGLRGLEMYQSEHSQWGQAHSQARFVILQVLLEAGQHFIELKETTGSDGQPNLLLSIDRSKITSVGKEAIANFLLKLQVYKSTGNIDAAKELFNKYSFVRPSGSDDGLPFLSYRDVVIARRQPRKMFVQGNTVVLSNSTVDPAPQVTLTCYEATHEGLIKSWVDRFREPNKLYAIMEELFERDRRYFEF